MHRFKSMNKQTPPPPTTTTHTHPNKTHIHLQTTLTAGVLPPAPGTAAVQTCLPVAPSMAVRLPAAVWMKMVSGCGVVVWWLVVARKGCVYDGV